jgi:hypothetical protein
MIDYNLISRSIEFYEKKGFNRIEAPWTVTEYIDGITKPEGRTSFQLKHNNKCLVASGEQSFLYLYLKDFLPKGQFQTTTPCFRFESFDYTHTKYFIKNELIKTDVVNPLELEKIVNTCFDFFIQYIPEIEVVKTEIGFDIEYKGNELGSYGIRENEYLKWIYATGCAEPRLSKIINLYKNGISQEEN